MKPLVPSLLFAAVVFAVFGCNTIRPQRGGGATAGPSPRAQVGPSASPESGIPSSRTGEGMPVATLSQPENPQASSGQSVSYRRETVVTVPTESVMRTETVRPDGSSVVGTETFPAGTQKRESVEQGVQQSVGGSWKDTAREVAAKLGSYKGVQWAGVVALVLAAAMFHPVVRTVIGGGKSTQVAVAVVGLVLVFGPALVVGHETELLIAAGVFLGWHWLTSRASYMEGKVDANKNGIPDNLENNKTNPQPKTP